MTIRSVLIRGVGLVAIAAIGIGIIHHWYNPTRMELQGQPDNDKSEDVSSMATDLGRLQDRLSWMERRLAAQGEKVSELASASAEAQAGVNDTSLEHLEAGSPSPDPDMASAERTSWLEQDFQQEPYDAEWSTAAEGRLLEVTRTSFEGIHIEDLECRSQTCRFTARFDDPRDQGPGPWAFALNRLFPTVEFVRSETIPGGVYYVTEAAEPRAEVE